MKTSYLKPFFAFALLVVLSFFLFQSDSEEYTRVAYSISEFREYIPERVEEVFVSPQCATFYKDELYVADFKRNEVFAVTKNWSSARLVAKDGKGPGEVTGPQHIRVVNDLIYVLDLGNQRIQLLDLQGRFLKSFQVRLFTWRNFAVNSKGNIFISRAAKDGLVAEYDPEGKLISLFGELKKPVEFQNTVNIEVDKDDNIYVIFFSQPIIQKYSADKKLLWESDISFLREVKERLKRISKDPRQEGIHSVIDESVVDRGYLYLLISGIHQKDVGGVKLFKFRCSDGQLAGELLIKSDRIIGFSGASFDVDGNLYFGDLANGALVAARELTKGSHAPSEHKVPD